jgi:hypothetical protein
MAITQTYTGRTLKLTNFNTEDWSIAANLPQQAGVGLKVKAIRFISSGANDVFIIRDGGIDAAAIFHANANDFAAAAEDHREEYGANGTWMFPVIDISDCTLGASASAIVIFELA